jgi:hypothetical protein
MTIHDFRNFSVREMRRDSEKVYYRVSLDAEELDCIVYISATQKTTYGAAALVSWCRRHVNDLRGGKIVPADLAVESFSF